MRGEPADVAYVRVGAPIVGSALGGGLGAIGGARMGRIFGGYGSAIVAIGGAIAGSNVGDQMGTFTAEQYARSKGYGGC